MNTKQIGNIGEAIALQQLLDLGYAVSLPFGDNERYDLILDIENTLYKVQIKSSASDGNKIKFDFRSTYAHRGNEAKKYNATEIDYIIGVATKSKSCFLFSKEVFENQSTKTVDINDTKYLLGTLLVRERTVNA